MHSTFIARRQLSLVPSFTWHTRALYAFRYGYPPSPQYIGTQDPLVPTGHLVSFMQHTPARGHTVPVE